jgi:hypothetical protein
MSFYLVCTTGLHGFDGHDDELGCDAAAAEFFYGREHGNIATVGTAAVLFKLADDDAAEGVCILIQGLIIYLLVLVLGLLEADWTCESANQKSWTYHITQITPLIQKIPIHINTIRLRQIVRYQLPDGIQKDVLLVQLILYISQAMFVANDRPRLLRSHDIGGRGVDSNECEKKIMRMHVYCLTMVVFPTWTCEILTREGWHGCLACERSGRSDDATHLNLEILHGA